MLIFNISSFVENKMYYSVSISRFMRTFQIDMKELKLSIMTTATKVLL